MNRTYTHMATCHFIFQETGHWRQSSIGLRKYQEGWISGEYFYNEKGEHSSGAYLDLKSIETLH